MVTRAQESDRAAVSLIGLSAGAEWVCVQNKKKKKTVLRPLWTFRWYVQKDM